MKENIKKIPLIGFLARWLNDLLRLSNLKFRIVVLEEKVKILEEQNNTLALNIKQLQSQEENFKTQLQVQEENLPKIVAKEIFYQSLSLQQRVDQFIFDSNIELKTKIAKEND